MAFRILGENGIVNANYNTNNLHENSFTQDLSLGKTRSKQWIFDGLQIIYSEAELDRLTEYDWKDEDEIFTMQFNLKGSITVADKGSADVYQLSGNTHNIIYGNHARGTIRFEELKMKSFTIQLSKKVFSKIVKENTLLKRFTANVVPGKSAVFSKKNGNIDLNLQQCINSILNCRLSPSLKRLFLYSKVIELLVLQIESLDRARQEKNLYIKKEYDRERILFARDYLLQHIALPPSLVELSRIAGINEYKLKKGFKEIFGQPIFEYLTEVRLDIAKNDLLNGDKTVTQIALELGYSSPQHFSTAFKKKFGISPSKA